LFYFASSIVFTLQVIGSAGSLKLKQNVNCYFILGTNGNYLISDLEKLDGTLDSQISN
jgi:hypothetical protein